MLCSAISQKIQKNHNISHFVMYQNISSTHISVKRDLYYQVQYLQISFKWFNPRCPKGYWSHTKYQGGGENHPTKWIVFTKQPKCFQYLIYFFYIVHYIRKTVPQKSDLYLLQFSRNNFSKWDPVRLKNVVQYHVQIQPSDVRIMPII